MASCLRNPRAAAGRKKISYGRAEVTAPDGRGGHPDQVSANYGFIRPVVFNGEGLRCGRGRHALHFL